MAEPHGTHCQTLIWPSWANRLVPCGSAINARTQRCWQYRHPQPEPEEQSMASPIIQKVQIDHGHLPEEISTTVTPPPVEMVVRVLAVHCGDTSLYVSQPAAGIDSCVVTSEAQPGPSVDGAPTGATFQEARDWAAERVLRLETNRLHHVALDRILEGRQ